MITRTITTTEVNAYCIDLQSKETFTTTVVLAGTFKEEKKMNKAVEKAVNSPLVKFIYVEDFSVKETLYGMDENFFIENATILPPRNTNK